LSEDVVKVAEAESEQEASMICGYLEENGIRAAYDTGGVDQSFAGNVAFGGAAFGGRQEIVVRADDAERATKLLAELPR
jgi:hypothetical protein